MNNSLLDRLLNEATNPVMAVVGSPSNNTEIMIDILQESENDKILGQMVYVVLKQAQENLIVLGQISKVETTNRWHEDPTFRGVIKRRGSLPHLSGAADIRMASIVVQASFQFGEQGDSEVTEGLLAMSPSTGAKVYRLTDVTLRALLRGRSSEFVYLGRIYGTEVTFPLWMKHFDKGTTGAGEAYHMGVFGRTGSGKSGLASYLIHGYARHPNMGILVIDPHGQFTEGGQLPFQLRDKLRESYGRDTSSFHLLTEVRLDPNFELFAELLKKVNFYKQLNITASLNQTYAAEVFIELIREEIHRQNLKFYQAPGDLLLKILTSLNASNRQLNRIYASGTSQTKLVDTLTDLTQPGSESFSYLEKNYWTPILDLFQDIDSLNKKRMSLSAVIGKVTGGYDGRYQKGSSRIVFLDLTGVAGETSSSGLNDNDVKALLLNQIMNRLVNHGEDAFKRKQLINALVVLDEAGQFAGKISSDGEKESAKLAKAFVKSVRETRKYGLGFMFITQSLSSIHPEIVGQLRIKFFGHGLNMGSDLDRLKQEIGTDTSALSLYRSFTDPGATKTPQYSFMVTGPASPLSFTGSPLFFQSFNSYEAYVDSNPQVADSNP